MGCGKHRYLLTFCCIIILSFKGLRKSKYELHRTKISKYELHRTKLSKNKLQRIKFPDFNFIGSVLHCEKSFWGLRKSKCELHRTKISILTSKAQEPLHRLPPPPPPPTTTDQQHTSTTPA
jgi:hypothetical protein